MGQKQGKGTTYLWRAKGLLFENCSCQVICPGHVAFDQLCSFERCIGYWAIHFEEGEFSGVPFGGLNVVIMYDCPQHMIEGDWTELILIDEQASEIQREKIETILTGKAGGPWEVLARFVSKRLKTRFVPIQIEDNGRIKKVVINGILDSSIEAIRGRDKSETVTLENMFNQVHAPSQVIAKGVTHYDDGEMVVRNKNSHALYSIFEWSVPLA